MIYVHILYDSIDWLGTVWNLEFGSTRMAWFRDVAQNVVGRIDDDAHTLHTIRIPNFVRGQCIRHTTKYWYAYHTCKRLPGTVIRS
jgi:hypothetical protein